MSTVRTKTLVLGDSGTLANNLQWKVPGVPDGTLTLERENGSNILSVNSGNLVAIGGVPSGGYLFEVYGSIRAINSTFVGGGAGQYALMSSRGTTTDGGTIVCRDTMNGFNAGGVDFYAGGAERMRIASNGVVSMPILQPEALRIPTVGFSTSTDSIQLTAGPGSRAFSVASGVVSGQIGFFAAGNSVGSITTTSAATSYNTSSDYRLKEGIASIPNALPRLMQLKPCGFTWKPDGSYDESFIAHELQEVCPRAVTGKKDAVKEDGTPDYQQIDPSKVVALLTAAMQEQQHIIQGQHSIIQDLQQRVANLEASK